MVQPATAAALAHTVLVFTTLPLTGVSATGNAVRRDMIMMPGTTTTKQVYSMKKYKWLIAGIGALILTAIIVLSVAAKSGGVVVCAEDGSCCVDPGSCT
jgi:predicted metal-binding membrane protein